MIRCLVSAAIGLGAVVLYLSTGSTAQADGGGETPVATGQVLRSDGSPASGATVDLYLASNDSSLAMELVATTLADSNGEYALALDDLSVISPSDLNDEGMVNFRVDTFAEGEVTTFWFSHKFATTTTDQTAGRAFRKVVAVDDEATEIPSDLVVIDAQPVEAPQALLADPTDPPPEEEPTGPPPTEEPGDGRPVVEGRCERTEVSTWKIRTVVGVGYHAVDGVPITFTYTEGASSTLGVGLSSSGTFGSWSANGTQSKSSSASVGFPRLVDNKDSYWSSHYRYRKVKEVCVYQSPGGGAYYNTRYFAEPKNFSGGSVLTTPSSLPDTPRTYCDTYQAGSTFTKGTTTAVQFAHGVKTGGVLGVELTARTGYESDAKLFFDFNQSRKLCGTNADPGGTAKQIVVRALSY